MIIECMGRPVHSLGYSILRKRHGMRYDTVPCGDGLAIHDSTLNQFIMDGKGNVLVLPTLGQAVKVITDLRERVGA